MLDRVRSAYRSATDWLMQPVLFAMRQQRRVLAQTIRSRFFWLASFWTASPMLAESVGLVWKAEHSTLMFAEVCFWFCAAGIWTLFGLTARRHYLRLHRRQRKAPTIR
jgi:hypothetical protein